MQVALVLGDGEVQLVAADDADLDLGRAARRLGRRHVVPVVGGRPQEDNVALAWGSRRPAGAATQPASWCGTPSRVGRSGGGAAFTAGPAAAPAPPRPPSPGRAAPGRRAGDPSAWKRYSRTTERRPYSGSSAVARRQHRRRRTLSTSRAFDGRSSWTTGAGTSRTVRPKSACAQAGVVLEMQGVHAGLARLEADGERGEVVVEVGGGADFGEGADAKAPATPSAVAAVCGLRVIDPGGARGRSAAAAAPRTCPARRPRRRRRASASAATAGRCSAGKELQLGRSCLAQVRQHGRRQHLDGVLPLLRVVAADAEMEAVLHLVEAEGKLAAFGAVGGHVGRKLPRRIAVHPDGDLDPGVRRQDARDAAVDLVGLPLADAVGRRVRLQHQFGLRRQRAVDERVEPPAHALKAGTG